MNYIQKIYSGRVNRKNYIWGILFFMISFMLGTLIFTTLLGDDDTMLIPMFLFLIALTFIVHIYSLHVRRLHDLGESGWKALFFLIPIVNIITLFWLLFTKSDSGSNKYGNQVHTGARFFDIIFNKNYKTLNIQKANIKYCHQCSTKLKNEAQFCQNCGAKNI